MLVSAVFVEQRVLAQEVVNPMPSTVSSNSIKQVLMTRCTSTVHIGPHAESDPAGSAQRRAAVALSGPRGIDANCGMIIDWSPRRGTLHAASGRHLDVHGGTVYHYVAAMGCNDTPGARRCRSPNYGFALSVWYGFDQVAT